MALSPTSSRGTSSGASVFSTATVTLTDAQIKALPTTGVEVVPAPGAGVVIVPILCWMHLTWVADYTNISTLCFLGLEYGTTQASSLSSLQEQAVGQVSNLLADGASHAAFLPSNVSIDGVTNIVSGFGQFSDDPNPVNAALNIFAAQAGVGTGNFTGGNAANSLKVTVYYATFTN